MADFLRGILGKQNKKVTANLATAFVIGIVLIICGSTFFKSNNPAKGIDPVATANETDAAPVFASDVVLSYEQQLEKRLESVYETVEGAGKVAVMVTLSYGREIIVAEDTTIQQSDINETDGQGVSREQHDKNVQETKIILEGRDGVRQPLILKEIEPQVEGVIIVAQGGDNVLIADALIRATQTVLGVEPHKVQVLKMKKIN